MNIFQTTRFKQFYIRNQSSSGARGLKQGRIKLLPEAKRKEETWPYKAWSVSAFKARDIGKIELGFYPLKALAIIGGPDSAL